MVTENETGDAAPRAPGADGADNLDLIARDAARLDQAPAQAEASESREVVLRSVNRNKAELHAALAMVRKAAIPMIGLRSERKAAALSVLWSDDTIEQIAEAGAEVLELHGVTLSSMTGSLGPYISLALALGPVAMGTKIILEMPEPKPEAGGGMVNGQQ